MKMNGTEAASMPTETPKILLIVLLRFSDTVNPANHGATIVPKIQTSIKVSFISFARYRIVTRHEYPRINNVINLKNIAGLILIMLFNCLVNNSNINASRPIVSHPAWQIHVEGSECVSRSKLNLPYCLTFNN